MKCPACKVELKLVFKHTGPPEFKHDIKQEIKQQFKLEGEGFGGDVGGHPESLPEGSKEASSLEDPNRARARKGRGDAKDYPVEFEKLWSLISPRRGNKLPAFKAWNKLKPTADEVLAGYRAWLETDQWKRGIIPHVSTWLNDQGWKDRPHPSELVARSKNGTQQPPADDLEAWGYRRADR